MLEDELEEELEDEEEEEAPEEDEFDEVVWTFELVEALSVEKAEEEPLFSRVESLVIDWESELDVEEERVALGKEKEQLEATKPPNRRR